MKKRTRGSGSTYLRGRIWWIQYWDHGVQRKESSQSTEQQDALDLLRQRVSDIAAGRDLTPEKCTIAELCRLVIADYRTRKLPAMRRSLNGGTRPTSKANSATYAQARSHHPFGAGTSRTAAKRAKKTRPSTANSLSFVGASSWARKKTRRWCARSPRSRCWKRTTRGRDS
jgi:hypothetical protein